MGKGRRVRAARAQKEERRAQAGHDMPMPFALPGGWQFIDDLDDVVFPDEALLDPSRCPVDDTCVGCGGRDGLAATTAAFSRPGGFDVACATVCHTCNGRSFLHMLHETAMNAAFARHAGHAAG